MYNKIVRTAPVVVEGANLVEKLVLLPRWKILQNQLVREIQFNDFETTWAFLTQISMRSHLWGHHPTITTSYNYVKLQLCTHELQEKVSDIDLKLAKRFEQYIEAYTQEE
ncbi:hypothetical protein ZYGM_002435 [Zygosaccharomyces mellis]|uniref:4a-hydroxytetrahydrobiopterin dehydratase n=1 Tax=Zygosaccharomyces mellis TaxID=42258 RepID=A0A4C2EAC8_9SACH|nr:hypothetical protein ZYGM_002435 [Zygosaccharomyces mellis]